MKNKTLTFLTLLAFIPVALLGLYFSFSIPVHGDMGCHRMPGEVVMCTDSALSHITHWQTAFAAIITYIGILLALAALFPSTPFFTAPLVRRGVSPVARHKLKPPNLFQELFSSGILNPKAP